MGFFDSFIRLFSGMSIMVFCIISVGLMLIIVEMFLPSRGVAAGSGSVLLVFGIVMRMFAGGTPGILFAIVFIVCTILFAAHALMLFTQKKEWSTQALSLALSKKNNPKNYAFLISLEGVTTTRLALEGHMSINDVNFVVMGDEIIEKGERVRVVEVEENRILVTKIKP